MIYTTLNKIREHSPCKEGWKKLLIYLDNTKAADDPLPLLTILNSNGMDDCLWSLRTVPEYNKLWRKYAVWCARQVEHLMTDERSKRALDVAWRHAEGKATGEELAAAREAAWATAREAAEAAWAEAEAVRAAAWAVRAASEAAWATAREAAWAAAGDAGWAASGAAAGDAAGDAAKDAAKDAARAAQETKLRTILSAGEWV